MRYFTPPSPWRFRIHFGRWQMSTRILALQIFIWTGLALHTLEHGFFGKMGSALIGMYVTVALTGAIVLLSKTCRIWMEKESAERFSVAMLEKIPAHASFDAELHIVTVENAKGEVLEQVSLPPDYDPEEDNHALLNKVLQQIMEKAVEEL